MILKLKDHVEEIRNVLGPWLAIKLSPFTIILCGTHNGETAEMLSLER